MSSKPLRQTERAHRAIRASLRDGDIAIDATAGNGHDTCFLANCVGSTGKVYAIDIQQAAIDATRGLLRKTIGDTKHVELILGDHAKALARLVTSIGTQVSAITFNLGYLPQSNKSIQTTASSTVRALELSLQLLRADGLLSVIAYRGHPGGREESEAVERWMRSHESAHARVDVHLPETTLGPILWQMRRNASLTNSEDS